MNAFARDIIVLGGSAGGIGALYQVLGSLPADFPAALFVVVHRGPSSGKTDSLADVLRGKTPLTVQAARCRAMPSTPCRLTMCCRSGGSDPS